MSLQTGFGGRGRVWIWALAPDRYFGRPDFTRDTVLAQRRGSGIQARDRGIFGTRRLPVGGQARHGAVSGAHGGLGGPGRPEHGRTGKGRDFGQGLAGVAAAGALRDTLVIRDSAGPCVCWPMIFGLAFMRWPWMRLRQTRLLSWLFEKGRPQASQDTLPHDVSQGQGPGDDPAGPFSGSGR